MGTWLDLEPTDIAAYVVCDILGLIVFFWLMPNIGLAIIASIFVSFHLFLAWLVIIAEREKGFSLPIVTTIFTHLACLLVVYLCSALVIALSGAALFLPIYFLFILRPIRYVLALCIPGLAVFERFWLFSGGRKKKEVPLTAAAAAAAVETTAAADAATSSDYDEWLHYVARQKPPFPKPGSSLKVEYERWLVARAHSHGAGPSNVKPA